MKYRRIVLAAVTTAALIGLAFPGSTLAQSGGPSDDPPLSPYWPTVVSRWEEQIVYYAGERDLDPDLIAAVIWKESKGRPTARSVVGAVGLMQLMPKPWRPSPEELENPWTNLFWGARALAHTIRDGKGDLYYSLAAYNGGWEQIHLRVTRYYATEVMTCYAEAVATRYGLPADGDWLAIFAIEGMAGPRTITVVGPHRALARYTERPWVRADIPVVPYGVAPHATAITFEDAEGTRGQVHVWLVGEAGAPVSATAPSAYDDPMITATHGLP